MKSQTTKANNLSDASKAFGKIATDQNNPAAAALAIHLSIASAEAYAAELEERQRQAASLRTAVTIQLPTDPAYWGSTATDSDVERILDNLETMIRGQFPELAFAFAFERCATPRFGGIFSSDESEAESIYEFIRDNWTAAL